MMNRPEQITQELTYAAPSGSWILMVTSPAETSVVRLEPGQQHTLGSSERCSVAIADPAVSQRHARVVCTPKGLEVTDLGSKNGLILDSARVSEARLLASGGHFQLGKTLVVARMEQPGEEVEETSEVGELIGASLAMRRLKRELSRAAGLMAPVLILGESGTGKDLAASALHRISARQGAFVPLNVGGLPESLADSELFGHCKGSFTGALADRPGAFELANRGTLFLDEIGELSPRLQVKLLRIVEDGWVRAVGASTMKHVNTRIVSATWANLSQRSAQGLFREDLLHRISTLTLNMPPLRKRKADIGMLAQALLRRSESELGPKVLNSAGLRALMKHHWPGNVRELNGVLYRAALCDDAELIGAEQVEAALKRGAQLGGGVKLEPQGEPREEPGKLAFSAKQLTQLLQDHAGNISAAARSLRVPRTTLRAWLIRANLTQQVELKQPMTQPA